MAQQSSSPGSSNVSPTSPPLRPSSMGPPPPLPSPPRIQTPPRGVSGSVSGGEQRPASPRRSSSSSSSSSRVVTISSHQLNKLQQDITQAVQKTISVTVAQTLLPIQLQLQQEASRWSSSSSASPSPRGQNASLVDASSSSSSSRRSSSPGKFHSPMDTDGVDSAGVGVINPSASISPFNNPNPNTNTNAFSQTTFNSHGQGTSTSNKSEQSSSNNNTITYNSSSSIPYLPFRAEEIGYFHPDLPPAYKDIDMFDYGGVLIFRDVIAFLDRLDDVLPMYGAGSLRFHLPLLFRGRANMWYTTLLTPPEKHLLRHGEGLTHWIMALTRRFRDPRGLALHRLEQSNYTIVDHVRKRVEPADYIYEVMRRAKTAGVHQPTEIARYAYHGIEPRLRLQMPAFDDGQTTVGRLLEAMECRKWAWFEKWQARDIGGEVSDAERDRGRDAD